MGSNWKSLGFFCLLAFTMATCANLRIAPQGGTVSNNTSARSGAVLSKEAKLRRDVLETAEQYLGTPYKYGSRSPQRGFDCSNFTSYVLAQHDIEVPAGSRNQITHGRRVRPEAVQPGDLVFFRRTKDGPVFHVALVESRTETELNVIHATNKRGVVRDDLLANSWWRTKFRSFRDVISVTP